ncbi:MAG: hypothetical protein K9W45_08515 [Candidatus Heimdallarchaeum aukensis]|uniref:Uncharacterized protein n=1 Tax=Candidatus Heimdallarchaeum aukensis TaxID=2876573 RepID=A0A9Y1BJ81_9ARCH|nr:MAG: hypothetical protein K9W45_08515 [Candidatus Heimdallarchaeum aukensis]
MIKLNVSDNTFLNDMATLLEEGHNIEQAIFNIPYMARDVLLEIQLGSNPIKALSLIEFQYPVIINLLGSLSNANHKENITRIKVVAALIKKRNEAIKEKENLVNILNRRLKIIRIITLVTIAIIGGIAPFFSGIYSFLIDGHIKYSFDLFSPMSISFLLINLLNNYFLLSISKESKIGLKLIIAAIVHIAIVLSVKILFGGVVTF